MVHISLTDAADSKNLQAERKKRKRSLEMCPRSRLCVGSFERCGSDIRHYALRHTTNHKVCTSSVKEEPLAKVPHRYRVVCLMDGRTVKAILFDLDDTLIETSRAGGAAIQKTGELLKTSLALDDVTVSDVCEKFKQKLLLERFEPSAGRSIDEVRVGHWEEGIQEAVGGGSVPSLAARCYHLWKSSRLEVLSLSPETRDLLTQLRRSYKLLLLTNGAAQVQREKVKAVGCEEFFDAIVVGGEHAEQKPSLSIFALCFDLLEVEAGDCVMVGDSLDTDIRGAFNAGVRATVWINRRGGAVPDGAVKPDYSIPTVLDLPDILGQLG